MNMDLKFFFRDVKESLHIEKWPEKRKKVDKLTIDVLDREFHFKIGLPMK